MSEIAERYARIADGFQSRLDGVRESDWANATPCHEWTVHDLVTHVLETHRFVLSGLGRQVGEADRDADFPAMFAQARGSVDEALADPETSAKVVKGPTGEQPFEALAGRLLAADTLLHTWDLARATHQDERLDAAGVAKCLEFLEPIDGAIRGPGRFAAKIEPAPGADEQTTLLNFAGRAV